MKIKPLNPWRESMRDHYPPRDQTKTEIKMNRKLITLRTGVKVMQETKNGITRVNVLTDVLNAYCLKPLQTLTATL
jgi:hypothetical protein